MAFYVEFSFEMQQQEKGLQAQIQLSPIKYRHRNILHSKLDGQSEPHNILLLLTSF